MDKRPQQKRKSSDLGNGTTAASSINGAKRPKGRDHHHQSIHLSDLNCSHSIPHFSVDSFEPNLSVPKEKAIQHGLPQRWMYCPPMGKLVADLFIPMKSPLCATYDQLITDPKY